ncbi:MAG: Ig-like domain-containing protein [Bacteroidota bacterium]
METPTGGAKDETAPVLLKSNLNTLNFKENVIKLTFDEHVELNDPYLNISLQPKHTTISSKTEGKSIIIKLDSALHPNTTYSFKIDNGIKDTHEGNKYSFNYIFSTGNAIDTNFITYKIENYDHYKGLKIGLSTKKFDSLKSLKFEYLYSLNNEKISVNGLNEKPYFSWIFTDNNNDNLPDEFEPIYYDTTLINSERNIQLNEWIDASNKKEKKYNNFIKIYKSINDISTYPDYPVIYIDKDSSLFYTSKKDTLPDLNLAKELSDKISDKIKGIYNQKDYQIIIDKCGITGLKITDNITVKEDENYFYLNTKEKRDSINFIFYYGKDSVKFYSKIKGYLNSKDISTLKLKTTAYKEPIIIYLMKDNKIVLVKKIDLKKDQIFYLLPGDYEMLILGTTLFKNTSFDIQNLRRSDAFNIHKSFVLKPNWDEVFEVVFQ